MKLGQILVFKGTDTFHGSPVLEKHQGRRESISFLFYFKKAELAPSPPVPAANIDKIARIFTKFVISSNFSRDFYDSGLST
jgi:hypothetical protein